jgi:hypothetical protein
MVELVRRYSNRPDLLYDLERVLSRLRTVAAMGAGVERLSVSSVSHPDGPYVLAERLTEEQEREIVSGVHGWRVQGQAR